MPPLPTDYSGHSKPHCITKRQQVTRKRHYLCSQDSQQLCTDTLGMLKELCVTFSGCFSHVSKPQVGPSWILGRKREDSEPGAHV